MSVTTNGNNLAKLVDDILDDFYVDVKEATQKSIKSVARKGAKMLRNTAPRGKGKSSGKYAAGWTSTDESTRIKVEAVIYGRSKTNKLAHLIEYGHLKRNGGRTEGNEHIKPVEEWVNQNVTIELRKEINAI